MNVAYTKPHENKLPVSVWSILHNLQWLHHTALTSKQASMHQLLGLLPSRIEPQ